MDFSASGHPILSPWSSNFMTHSLPCWKPPLPCLAVRMIRKPGQRIWTLGNSIARAPFVATVSWWPFLHQKRPEAAFVTIDPGVGWQCMSRALFGRKPRATTAAYMCIRSPGRRSLGGYRPACVLMSAGFSSCRLLQWQPAFWSCGQCFLPKNAGERMTSILPGTLPCLR